MKIKFESLHGHVHYTVHVPVQYYYYYCCCSMEFNGVRQDRNIQFSLASKLRLGRC